MRFSPCVLALCCALACAAPARAAEGVAPQPVQEDWISLTGTVGSVSGDRLSLITGAGDVEVALAGFDAAHTAMIRPGDRVGVTGRIDGGVFRDRRIAAESVYVARLNRLLGGEPRGLDSPRKDDDWVIVTGRVTAVKGDDFILETGGQRLEIDADDGGPADIRGLKVGDRVSVTGTVERDGREIDATSVIVLPGSGAS